MTSRSSSLMKDTSPDLAAGEHFATDVGTDHLKPSPSRESAPPCAADTELENMRPADLVKEVRRLRLELAYAQQLKVSLDNCWGEAAFERDLSRDVLTRLHTALTNCKDWTRWGSVALRLAERETRRCLRRLEADPTADERRSILKEWRGA